MNYEASATPVNKLKTNRGLVKLFLLTLVTFGIYPLFFYNRIAKDVNTICARDGKKTMNYWLLSLIVAPLTCGIGALVWCHRISNRIGDELTRRNIGYSFNAGTFWIWNILGSFIAIGPLVYIYKLCKAMNLLATSYNNYG